MIKLKVIKLLEKANRLKEEAETLRVDMLWATHMVDQAKMEEVVALTAWVAAEMARKVAVKAWAREVKARAAEGVKEKT